MDLQVTTRRVGERVVVALGGIADLSTAPVLHDRLRRAVVDHPAGTLVVDLDGVLVLDDVALGLLLGAAANARSGGGELELVCTDERLRSRLSTTRLDLAITVRDSIA